ncbi:uncharacterized protein LAESUDRAFT_732665 [Laetiporus sulphureus 93-53]|uniref:Uncharacterized protein n=1 Tax=Laetiporus sulphureus 93-53 TaxID=1314785 RepID=A0A165B130_9APHY|nr:uncharacterized protein LAESUDRAFT_732665 [Laetiporus sulphureus 93-53]KZT00028.1 hypothetical protein LAESUDRAFT_732665 [Laetiporus sulphureus 93-53]
MKRNSLVYFQTQMSLQLQASLQSDASSSIGARQRSGDSYKRTKRLSVLTLTPLPLHLPPRDCVLTSSSTVLTPCCAMETNASEGRSTSGSVVEAFRPAAACRLVSRKLVAIINDAHGTLCPREAALGRHADGSVAFGIQHPRGLADGGHACTEWIKVEPVEWRR